MWLPSEVNMTESSQNGNYMGWPLITEQNASTYYP